MNNTVGISVIVPVTERVDSIENLLTTYYDVLAATGREFEIICVLDGKFAHLAAEITQISDIQASTKVISLSRIYGESVALAIAVERALYDLVLTLPSYEQVESSKISMLLDHIGLLAGVFLHVVESMHASSCFFT